MLPIFRQAKLLRMSILLSFTATLILFAHSASVSAISSQGIINLTNAERSVNGLRTLTTSGALSSSAAAKAQDMCDKNYWAHTSPDGLTGWTFMSQAGYAYTSAGENLAKDYASDNGVVSGWMESPTHRANMLSSDYVDIGAATLNCNETLLVVAHYGVTAKTSSPPTPAKIEPPVPATAPSPVEKSVKNRVQNNPSPKATKTLKVPVEETPAETPVVEQTVEPVIEPVLSFVDEAKVQENTENITEHPKQNQTVIEAIWSYVAVTLGFLGSIRLKMSF